MQCPEHSEHVLGVRVAGDARWIRAPDKHKLIQCVSTVCCKHFNAVTAH